MTVLTDFQEWIDLARRGDETGIVAALARGADAKATCEHTGTSALLVACAGNHAGIVRILLEQGADPDHSDFDGYNAYDGTREAAIRRLLLDFGFSLTLEQNEEARGKRGRRVLAAKAPHSSRWAERVTGRAPELECLLRRTPPPKGSVAVSFVDTTGTARSIAPEPGRVLRCVLGEVRDDSQPVELALADFVGDVQIRVFDRETLQGNSGPIEFWLPAWEDESPHGGGR